MSGGRGAGDGQHAWTALVSALAVAGVLLASGAALGAGAPGPHGGPLRASGLVRPANGTTFQSSCGGSLPVVGGLCIQAGGEQPLFFLTSNVNPSYNFSFSAWWLAEITPAGSVVGLSNLIYPVPERTSVHWSTGWVNFSEVQISTVTNASGGWTPADVQSIGGGPNPITQGTATLGNTTFGVVFHLQNSTSNLTEVKFDISVSGWPWVSPSDELGVVLGALAPGNGHFTWAGSNSTLIDHLDSTNATLSTLAFGGSANVTAPARAALAVTSSAAIWTEHPSPPDRSAAVLLTFTGTEGGYSSLVYDPLVTFATPNHGPPGNQGPPGSGLAGPPASGGSVWGPVLFLALGGGMLVTAVFAGISLKARRHSLEVDLSPAAA